MEGDLTLESHSKSTAFRRAAKLSLPVMTSEQVVNEFKITIFFKDIDWIENI